MTPTKKREARRILKAKITPARLMRAIQGSAGIKRVIAEKLDVTYSSIWDVLHNPKTKWDDCRAAIKIEEELVGDIAEETVRESMQQRIDMSVASTTARWYLEKRRKSFEPKSRMTLEGGKTPLQVQQTYIPIGKLNLPLAVKVQVLEAMEQYQEENGGLTDD